MSLLTSPAICFKCAAQKIGPIIICRQCGAAPRGEEDLVRSLAMCEEIASKAQLAYCSQAIRGGHVPILPDSLVAKAHEARKTLATWRTAASNSAAPQRTTTSTASAPQPGVTSAPNESPAVRLSPRAGTPAVPPKAPSKPIAKDNALSRNPFAVIGATIRDNRQKIVSLAEEKSLDIGDEASQKARAELTSPRTRLAAEIGWLPGVSPGRATRLLVEMHDNPIDIWRHEGLPSLAQANLMAAAFELVDAETPCSDLANLIVAFAERVDSLSPEDIMRDINGDRLISGFQGVTQPEHVESVLVERKRDYRDSIRDGLLERLAHESIFQTMTLAADRATQGGHTHGPQLIHDVVDAYEVKIQVLLDDEGRTLEQCISLVRERLQTGGKGVDAIIDKLESVARNWDRFAQPIQLSYMARGKDHHQSVELARAMRNLSVDLYVDHDLLSQTSRITDLLKELFAELPHMLALLAEDDEALAEIRARKTVEDEVSALRLQAKQGKKLDFDKLVEALDQWDEETRPIREREQSNSKEYAPSEQLARELRSFSIDVFNEHGLLEDATRLSVFFLGFFSTKGMSDIAKRFAKDRADLADIEKKRGDDKARNEKWEQEIAFSAEWGTFIKHKLRLSPAGVDWDSQHFPLDQISRVQWGSVRHSINGVPTGTTCHITIGTEESYGVIELKNDRIYSEFVDKLWRAAGVPILIRLLEGLKKGQEFNFGNATVKDEGIVLSRSHFFKAPDRIPYTWSQVQVYTQNGAFVVESKTDKKARVELSYIHAPNAHVLDHAIRTAFKNNANKLSELLG